MAMEIEVEDHSNLILEKGHKAVFGRGNGLSTNDRTVSRRHVLFESEHKSANQTEPSVSFEVLGRIPYGSGTKRMGELGFSGGRIRVRWRPVIGSACLGREPFGSDFRVGNVEAEQRERGVLESESELADDLQSGSELEGLDVSGIDPVKEFGFVVMGHEFDPYPKQMICDVKKWNWFLEEP